ncbi:MAG: molybdopterin-dependent oxidoreductase, partial [Propionivibrio sp.]|nr:molybdopterin-dependent oxidoreductase [Propionivibrio sp.]
MKRETPQPVTETRSTCCYCGTGCGVIVQSVGDRIVGVEGDPAHPANFGKLCTKGNTLHLAAVKTGRALVPMLRASRVEQRTPTSWESALDTAAERFASIIREHGPDAVAFYISGQLLTEDYYVFNKLARALVGTNNIDSNSRLCMSSAVAAYKATLGSDAVPCSYEDIDLADLFLITGANPAYAHPVLFRRIEAARAANPDLKLIVVDPRRTDTAAEADLHLAITPGSDVLLYSAMLHVLLWEGLVDHAFIAEHTAGFDDLRRQIAEFTPGAVAAACGVKAEDIVTAARWFGQAKAPLSFWCQGLNQSIHGTNNGAALIHLHLATGTIGKPGMGPFSLTGQPNAMGGREAGAMANLLPGHRNLASADDRAELAALWGIPSIPEQAGKTAVELFDAVREGKIKAVWIACTNPAHSLPDLNRVREALETAEFVVVQDAWGDTETTAFADLILPAATWGEKDGTVTNSERRVSRVRAAVPPPGEARADWRIARDFALVLGEKLSKFRHPGAQPHLPLQGGGREGDGVIATASGTHPHPNPPLEREGALHSLFHFTTPA